MGGGTPSALTTTSTASRTADGFSTVSIDAGTLTELTFVEIAEEQAVRWLSQTRRGEEASVENWRSPRRIALDWVVTRDELFRFGSKQYACPPPAGQHAVVQLPRIGRT